MLSQLEYLHTEYRTDLDVWICRWFDFADSAHLQKCYNLIFDEALKQDIHYWLVDIRSRPRADKQDYDWYFNEFLPEKVTQLNGNNYLAYLVTPSHYSYITEMETLTKFETIEKVASLKTRFFQSEQVATDWLVQARLANNMQ